MSAVLQIKDEVLGPPPTRIGSIGLTLLAAPPRTLPVAWPEAERFVASTGAERFVVSNANFVVSVGRMDVSGIDAYLQTSAGSVIEWSLSSNAASRVDFLSLSGSRYVGIGWTVASNAVSSVALSNVTPFNWSYLATPSRQQRNIENMVWLAPTTSPPEKDRNWLEREAAIYSPESSQILFLLRDLRALSKRALSDQKSIDRFARASGDVIAFLSRAPNSLAEPKAAVAEDGEIVFEWKTGSKHAVVDFEGDGVFGYALLKDGRFRPGDLKGDLTRSLPDDLLEYLRG